MGLNLIERQHEAVRMLELFASVGVRQFDITFTSLDAQKRGFRPNQQLDQVRCSMRSSVIESCTAGGRNIIIRPHSPPGALLIQCDDLNTATLTPVSSAAFLVLCTSPGNHQAWVAVKDWTDADFARRVRQAAGADPSASGATRVAGTVNFKRKYQPDFPTVAIVRSAPGGMVSSEQLHGMGLVAAAPARVSRVRPGQFSTRAWPSYERCLAGAPLATSGRRDSLRADFTWCLIAADWGHSAEEIGARLMQLSSKARENGPKYAAVTAQRAAAARGKGVSK